MNENLESETTFLKTKKASSDGGQDLNQSPSGDANFLPDGQQPDGQMPPMDPNGTADPSMDPNGMGDPSMGQNGMTDPSMDQNGMSDPSMDPMADPSMDPMNGGGEGDMADTDSTTNIIKQLDPESLEAVRNFALSYLNKNQGGADMGGGDAPMMESVIFTKKQINEMNENFSITNDDELKHRKNKEKGLAKKHTNNVSKRSPFNSPIFGKA